MEQTARPLTRPINDEPAHFRGRIPFDREAKRNGPYFLPGPMIARDMILLQLSPLRACNVRCLHCFISNEHKKIKDVMSLDLMKRSFDVMFDFASHVHAGGLEIEIMGGEVHMMPANDLYDAGAYMLDKCMDHLEWRAAEGQPDTRMIIESDLITNLIHCPPEKLEVFVALTEYFKREHARRKDSWGVNEITHGILTSYESDTRRFNNDRALQSWKQAIHALNAKGVETHVIYTLTKGTLETPPEELHRLAMNELNTIEYSIDYASPYGEGGTNRSTVISDDYEKTAEWMTRFSRMGNQVNPSMPHLKSIDPPIERGRTLEYFHNRILAEAMIDFDGSLAVEEMLAPTMHWQNKGGGTLETMTRREAVDKLIAATQARHRGDWRDLVKQGCLACRHQVECQGGHQHFRSVFTEPGQCMGVKPYLDAMYPEQS